MRDAADVALAVGENCSLDGIPTDELESLYHWIGLELDNRKDAEPSPRPSTPEGAE